MDEQAGGTEATGKSESWDQGVRGSDQAVPRVLDSPMHARLAEGSYFCWYQLAEGGCEFRVIRASPEGDFLTTQLCELTLVAEGNACDQMESSEDKG